VGLEAEEEEVKRVALPATNAVWRKLRRAQTARSKESTEALRGALPQSEAARRFWSRRTWSELAAVPAVSQVVLALVREGAGLGAIGAYATIAQDEVRHADLSLAMANALGGYDEEVPHGLEYSPRSLAAPSDVPVVVWALANGCFSETVSLALIQARHAATTHPTVRAVLAETLKDEALHVRVAWQLAGDVLPKLLPRERRELLAYATELAEMTRRTFGTSGLSPKLRAQENRLRDETARAGLGARAAAEENVIVNEALVDVWARLGALGLR
jgi:hypothetical protein